MFSIKRAQKEAERNYRIKNGDICKELETKIDKAINDAVKEGQRTITYYIPEEYEYSIIMNIEKLYRKEGYGVLIEYINCYVITIGW